MTSLRGDRVERFLKRPNLNLVLFHGNDPALINARANAVARGFDQQAETVRLGPDAFKDNPGRLTDEARAISLFGGRRVIRVAANGPVPGIDGLLADPPSDALIVIERTASLKTGDKLRKLFEGSSNGVVIGCYTGDAGSIGTVLDDALNRSGLTITPEARARTVELTLGLGVGARAEIEKLCLYAAGETEITLGHVDAVLEDGASGQIGRVCDLLVAGEAEEADRMIRRVLAAGVDAGAIALVLLRQLTLLHRLAAAREGGVPLGVALKGIRPPVFAQRQQEMERQLGRWSLRGLEQALHEVECALRDSRVRHYAGSAVVTNVLTRLPRLITQGERT